MPIAGKTGTTSQNYDVWFSGYTPYYCCSVWGGYDVNTSLRDASYHKGIWKRVMQRVHEGLEYKEFEIPDTLEQVKVCQTSGKLATKSCPVTTEYLEKGTGPTTVCTLHVESYKKTEETQEPQQPQPGEEGGTEPAQPDAGAGGDTPLEGEAQPQPAAFPE